jgi:hypothetical protein
MTKLLLALVAITVLLLLIAAPIYSVDIQAKHSSSKCTGNETCPTPPPPIPMPTKCGSDNSTKHCPSSGHSKRHGSSSSHFSLPSTNSVVKSGIISCFNSTSMIIWNGYQDELANHQTAPYNSTNPMINVLNRALVDCVG